MDNLWTIILLGVFYAIMSSLYEAYVMTDIKNKKKGDFLRLLISLVLIFAGSFALAYDVFYLFTMLLIWLLFDKTSTFQRYFLSE